MESEQNITQLCINVIRALSADQPQAAKSGHPGAPMGLAPVAHLLWSKFMQFSPTHPKWINRDRFVLSNGHACALLYSMLHLSGYNLSIDDLKAFRQVESKTPGHPEANHTDGVEVTTGPLGQGLANGVGIAIAEAHMAAHFNKPGFELFNNHTFVICGDGCLQEGITSEASSLAGHLGLGNLIIIYDDNKITIDGETELSFTEDVVKRYEAYGFHVQTVDDGDHDLEGITKAIEQAKSVTDRPSFIKVRTTIGFSSAKQGKESVHGSPLGDEDLANVKKKLGLDPTKKFYVPDEVRAVYNPLKERGETLVSQWNELFNSYAEKFPELAAELKRRISGEFPQGWAEALPAAGPDAPPTATRKLSQAVINKLGETLPELIGGSADLNPSTLTYLNCSVDFQKATPEGRNIRFGVREHAMASICNGIASYGGLIPYCSTFLNFIGYAFGAVILSAISRVQVLYIMTHDSIGLGEDGPTHQPVEKFMMCRITPNIQFLRPCDGAETKAAYIAALHKKDGPSVIALTRQNVPMQKNTSVEGALKGAYTIRDPEEGEPEIIFIGTGSEVSLCIEAAEQMTSTKVRVVSMPCWELFDKQPLEYRKSVLLPGVPAIGVEAGSTIGWSRYSHGQIGVDRFGYSGPYTEVYEKLGVTVANIVEKATRCISFYKQNPVPTLLHSPFDN